MAAYCCLVLAASMRPLNQYAAAGLDFKLSSFGSAASLQALKTEISMRCHLRLSAGKNLIGAPLGGSTRSVMLARESIILFAGS
jgi:hypothetical protein